MSEERGREVGFSLPRRWIGDMLHFAQKVPLVAGEGTLRVRALSQARRALPHPPELACADDQGDVDRLDAIAGVAAGLPTLPWPRLYEAPYPVATVIFDRLFQGEHATFMTPMVAPQRLTLARIHDKVKAWQTIRSRPTAYFAV